MDSHRVNIHDMLGPEEIRVNRRDTANDATIPLLSRESKKDKPLRPLSAYNLFFQTQWDRIIAGNLDDPTPEEIEASVTALLKSRTRGPKRRQDRISHGKISFEDFLRTNATKWKGIDPNIKAIYDEFARQEQIRYKEDYAKWKAKHYAETMAIRTSAMMRSTGFNNVGRFRAPFHPLDSIDSLGGHSRGGLPQDDTIQRQEEDMHSLDSIDSLDSHSCGGLPQDDTIQRQEEDIECIDSKPPARIDGGGNDNDSVEGKIPRNISMVDSVLLLIVVAVIGLSLPTYIIYVM